MSYRDTWLVIGTRTEAIKLTPVAHALAAHGLSPTVILTGQQRLNPGEFDLEAYPNLYLHCPDKVDPHAHVRAVTYAFIPLLADPPRLILVPRDTSSALGAALAAFMGEIPVAHIDAGLRASNLPPPWPAQEYSSAIDARADLLFAPTESAAKNLRAEEVHGEIHVTGNDAAPAIARVIADWVEERSLTRRLA